MFNRPELAIFDLNNTLYDYEIPNESGKAALMSFSSKHLGKSEVEVHEGGRRPSIESRVGY